MRNVVALAVAALAVAACETSPPEPTVVTVTVRAGDAPVAGAHTGLRLLHDSGAVTARTDASGRVRLELGGGAAGPGLVDVAPDTAAPRPEWVYAPVLVEPGARADLTVDLDAHGPEAVRYGGRTRAERWGWAGWMFRSIAREHSARYRAAVAAGRADDLAIDWSGTVDTLRSALTGESDPEVRTALWMALLRAGLGGAEVTAAEADRALREAEPAAQVWASNPYGTPSLIAYAAGVAEGVDPAGDPAADDPAPAAEPGARIADGQDVAGRRELAARRTAAFTRRVVDAQTHPGVQPTLLLAALRHAGQVGRWEEAAAYYQRLVERYPDTREARLAEKDAPGRRIEVGSPVPDVPLPALDSTAPPIAPDQLAGPATLVDFWAAWCTPCVAEMPVIHEAYERFRDRGFDVVSVSYDAYRADVHAFREQYPMPWRHAFVGADRLSTGEVATAWGVTGLPAAFLVGPDGAIIALESDLRGERLEATLERVLGRPSP